MSDNVYQLGDLVPLEATFKNAAGALTNTTVALTVRAPDGTISTPTPTNPSTGVYHYDLNATQAGLYWYTFKGSGALQAADRNSFIVEDDWISTTGPLSPTALVGLEDAREEVLRNRTDDSQDSKLVWLINVYSDAVAAYTRREWLPAATGLSRKFTYTGGGFLSLEPFELRNLTSITMYTDMPAASQRVLIAGSSTVQGEYRLHPPNRTDEGTYQWITMPQAAYGVSSWGTPSYYNNPYPYGPVGRTSPLDFEVTVVGDWGIGTVPYDVKQAVLIAIKNAYENPVGYGSGSDTIGSFTFNEPADALVGPESRSRNLPIDARSLLTPYKRGSQVVTA